MQGVTREDVMKAEETLQAADTDDTPSTDSQSDNGSSQVSLDVRCRDCLHANGLLLYHERKY